MIWVEYNEQDVKEILLKLVKDRIKNFTVKLIVDVNKQPHHWEIDIPEMDKMINTYGLSETQALKEQCLFLINENKSFSVKLITDQQDKSHHWEIETSE